MGLAGFLRLYGKDTMVRFVTLVYVKTEKFMIEYNRKEHEEKENITLESSVGFTAIFNGEGYGLRHVSSFRGNGHRKTTYYTALLTVLNLNDLMIGVSMICFYSTAVIL